MTDFVIGLMVLFPGENVSPKVADGTYEQINATWRGSRPCPPESEIEAAALQWYQENEPENLP